jgi:hypothetical protein
VGAYFDRLGKSPEELLEDSEAIAYLTADPSMRPEPRKKSLVHTLRYPIQDHKLRPGQTVQDPATGRSAGEFSPSTTPAAPCSSCAARDSPL